MEIQKIIDKLFNNKIKEQVVKLSVGETIIPNIKNILKHVK